jgi:hypothetical protein
MTVKIDGVEPNIFPAVEHLDARGKPTAVTVKLTYEQASDLGILLEPFRKP